MFIYLFTYNNNYINDLICLKLKYRSNFEDVSETK